jgi:hypothetical protein
MDANCECDPWDGVGHSVTAARADLQFANNTTWMDAFQFGTLGDTTWTLAGQTFSMDIQINPYDTTPMLQLNTANGRIVVDDIVQRVLHFNVTPTDIQANLRPGIYVYDLVMVDTAIPPSRVSLMYGTVEVIQGVTYP